MFPSENLADLNSTAAKVFWEIMLFYRYLHASSLV
jgi:hypothetical protein